jgi:outer membrane protein TolC
MTRLEQKRAAAEAGLNALLNRSATDPVARTEWPETVVTLEPLGELTARLAADAPELQAAEEAVLRSEESLKLARQEYYPDFALMGAYMNKDGLFPEWEVGLRVKVPLYFWRRQRAGVAEAAFAKSAAEHERRNMHVSLEGRLRELYSMSTSARRLVELYHDTLVPQAALTFESARASYAVGKVDFLTTLSAFTALLEYQIGYAEQWGDLYRARAEIAPLVRESPLDWWGAAP